MEMAPYLPVLSRELKEQGSEWTNQFGSWFWVSDIAVGWVPISPKVILEMRGNVMDAEVGLPLEWKKKEAAGTSRMGIVYFHHIVVGKACHNVNLERKAAQGMTTRKGIQWVY